MKKYLFFFFSLLLIHTFLSAQDYNNIITNGSAFYSGSSNEAGFLSGIRSESVNSQGNGDTLFLATNTIRHKTPANSPLDTVGGILGREIVKLHTGWFWFFNTSGDTIFLNNGATLNDFWKFCNLPLGGQVQATCTSIESVPLPGTSDTVKKITFQAKDSNGVNISNYYNGKSIQLSRQYGFTKIFDLYHFPDTTAVFTLEGKNSPAIGFQGMTWHDVYDFEVGDEFHFVGYENFLWGNHPSTRDYVIMKKVLAKLAAPGEGTVTYTFEFCKEVTEGTPMGVTTTYSYDTVQVSYPYVSSLSDPTINWVPEQFTHTDYRYYSTLYHLVPGRPAYGHSGNYYHCCWGLNPYFNLYIKDDREYTKGLGQVHYKNYWMYFDLIKYDYENLVYYKKGNEQWGSPVYTDCSAMIPFLSASPDTVVLGWESGSLDTLFIISNTSWIINSTALPFWASTAGSSGSGNGMVRFYSTSENTDHAIRMAPLTLESPAGNRRIMLIQSGKSSGYENISAERVKISPNPIETKATLYFSGQVKNQEKQVSLFDFTGRLVFQVSFTSEVYIFNRGTFTSGIYFLKVSYQNDKQHSISKVILD